MKLVFAICTVRRPKMLRDCLESIASQNISRKCSVSVVLVENDEIDHSSAIAYDSLKGKSIHLVHELEPERGIPIARNRSVELSLRDGADWIAFVDDDERLEPGWINAMTTHAASGQADVYTGPVISEFPEHSPDWIEPTRGYGNRQHGDFIKKAATNNTLVSSSLFAADGHAMRFNETMRYTGGSDGELFKRAKANGVKIMWVADALVRETVPDERLTLHWNLTRKLRTSANRAIIMRSHRGAFYAWTRLIPKIAGRTAKGLSGLILASVRFPAHPSVGRQRGFEALRELADGAGLLTGLFGFSPEPYRKLDGS